MKARHRGFSVHMPDLARDLGACPYTGLRTYPTRDDAKRKVRQDGLSRDLRPFKCDRCQMFHLGRLHDEVKRGEVPRRESGQR